MGKLTISMAIFSSYVALPEGKYPQIFEEQIPMSSPHDGCMAQILHSHSQVVECSVTDGLKLQGEYGNTYKTG